jgi:3-oxoacyl-[acyl-carrier protein] reductase/pteridine reductase
VTAKPLAGKAALVTGAAKRIGRAIALALAEAGADVAITFRESEQEAAQTVAAVEAFGVKGSAHRCDLDDAAAIAATVAAVAERYGRLDVLVNNAGRFESVALEQISPAQWDSMFAANTRGPFFMAQACYPHLKAAGGRIVNVGSLGGITPWATHGHYCASKAALHMLSKTMAKAWGPEVSVNCVAPGMIEADGESVPSFAMRTPLRRNGTGADVAAAVVYFASAAGFITGQVLTVDGGLGL